VKNLLPSRQATEMLSWDPELNLHLPGFSPGSLSGSVWGVSFASKELIFQEFTPPKI